MKKYVREIYDEIIKSDDNNDILISGEKGIRIIILILAKIYHLVKLQVISFFCKLPDIEGKNIAVVLTLNQMRSISDLQDNNTIIAIRPYLDSAQQLKAKCFYFSPFRELVDLFRHINYINKYGSTWKQQYNSVAYFYYYAEFKRFFRNSRPKSVTITNPSHPILRSAINAARELGIPTVYLPHASTSPLYPTITTTHALLEGTDAQTVYKFAPETKVCLVGSPRLDPYKNMRARPHEGINLLVAANLLDDIDKVYDLFVKLKKHHDTCCCKLLFRPHPNLQVDKQMFQEIGVEVISPKTESCLESLERTDVLISGNSTIFFEAIYLPIRSYYYDFLKEGLIKDSYNLASYDFVHTLNMADCIDLAPYSITKQEADRIDVTIYNKQKSINLISSFYGKL